VISVLVSAQANASEPGVKPRSGGRSQNEQMRQAIRGLREVFRKDGLLK
jgi:hypothetical protein